jgi:hypothetical protein
MRNRTFAKVLLIAVALIFVLAGCSRAGHDFIYRSMKHLELHTTTLYKQFTDFHHDIDRFIFKLDEEDPTIY